MSLNKQHLLRNPEERVIGKRGQNRATCEEQFNRSDRVLQEVLADIVNGLTRNDIVMKFKFKQYENQKKSIGERQAYEYIKMAYRLMAEDRVKEQNQLRDQLYNQYLALYNELVVNNNPYGAKGVLDSMAKIFLPPAEQNINLNGNIDGNVTIEFNFVEDEG